MFTWWHHFLSVILPFLLPFFRLFPKSSESLFSSLYVHIPESEFYNSFLDIVPLYCLSPSALPFHTVSDSKISFSTLLLIWVFFVYFSGCDCFQLLIIFSISLFFNLAFYFLNSFLISHCSSPVFLSFIAFFLFAYFSVWIKSLTFTWLMNLCLDFLDIRCNIFVKFMNCPCLGNFKCPHLTDI